MIPPDAQPHDIATADEVLATFTMLMRGEKSSEQLKAAEQLAKYHSLFTPKEEAAIRPEVIAEVEAAVRQLQLADGAPSAAEALGAAGALGAAEALGAAGDMAEHAAPGEGGP